MKTDELEWAKGLNWPVIGTYAAKLFDATVLAVFAERGQRLRAAASAHPSSSTTFADDATAPIAVSSNIAIRALFEFFESNSENNPLRYVEHTAAVALVQLAGSNARAVPVIGGGAIADAVLDALAAPSEPEATRNDLTPEETVASETPRAPKAEKVFVGSMDLTVQLDDGRTLQMPLDKFPRLYNASQEQRQHHELIGGGEGVRWPEIDEDLSVAGFLKMLSDQGVLVEPSSMQSRLDAANKRIAELEAEIERREDIAYNDAIEKDLND